MPRGTMDGQTSTGTLIGRPGPQISKPPRTGVSSMAGRVAGHLLSDEDSKKHIKALDDLREVLKALTRAAK